MDLKINQGEFKRYFTKVSENNRVRKKQRDDEWQQNVAMTAPAGHFRIAVRVDVFHCLETYFKVISQQ